jgi:hypothetical protein
MEEIETDIFVHAVGKLVSALGMKPNKALIFTVLYNLIPALIFGPLLLYKGRCYKDKVLMFIGLALIVVDTHHFIKAVNKLETD